MTIPEVSRVRDGHASGISAAPAITVNASDGFLGMLIAFWVWSEGSTTLDAMDYEGKDAAILGSGLNGTRRLTHGYVKVPPEVGISTGSLSGTLSASDDWWIAYHLYRNVDFDDPVWNHIVFTGDDITDRAQYCMPGGMMASAVWAGTDYQPRNGMATVRTVSSTDKLSGEEPGSDDGDEGWVLGGWWRVTTGSDFRSAYMTINPIRTALPRRQLYYRRDRAMAGLPLSQPAPVD